MNPQDYEEVYGYSLLDDLHNLFPEILYDNEIFPHDTHRILSWMRHRMTGLFPQIYRRNRVIYSTRTAPRSRNEYEDWQFLTHISVRAPQQMRMNDLPLLNRIIEPSQTVNDTGFSSRLMNSILGNTTLPTNNVLWNSPTVSYRYQLNTMPLSNQTTLNTGLSNLLHTFFDSVPVNASMDEIAAATTVVDVSGDVICPICQDNAVPTSPTVTDGAAWRRLNGCGHQFHRSCVDRWFDRNVHCPVCRADIRDAARLQAEAIAEQALSNMADDNDSDI